MFIRTLFFFLLSVLQVMGQQVKYASPLNIPLRLSGNFCEVRTDHFHSGIDIKTNGREGQPVFAVDDGYVSRVKISAVGYGKAIYITHSDHCVTVYGHLHSFMGALADSLESKQYARKSFEIEWFPDSSYFPVKRGQQIAWSGNSGGSESPHLHFEIRDEFTEEPLNPLLNGWTVNDTIAPIIQNVSIYNYSDGRYFFDNNYPVDKIESIGSNDTLFVNSDTVALSFVMNDEMNDSVSSSLGIYSVLLLNGTDSVYHYSFNRMNFNETRNVNGYIDYSKKENQKEIFLRCFALPGNRFSAFKNAGKGLIYIKQGETVHLKLLVSDANQNISKLELNFKGIAVDDSTLKGDSFIHYPNKNYEIQIYCPILEN